MQTLKMQPCTEFGHLKCQAQLCAFPQNPYTAIPQVHPQLLFLYGKPMAGCHSRCSEHLLRNQA